MVYLATQITEPSLLVSGWYHPTFVGQTSHIFKNCLDCTMQWTLCVNILHIIPCTIFIALCIMSVVWAEWVGVSGIWFFFSLSWKAHSDFMIVSTCCLWDGCGCDCMVQCISVGRREEAASQEWSKGGDSSGLGACKLLPLCTQCCMTLWCRQTGSLLRWAFPFICCISIYSANINWTSVVKQ